MCAVQLEDKKERLKQLQQAIEDNMQWLQHNVPPGVPTVQSAAAGGPAAAGGSARAAAAGGGGSAAADTPANTSAGGDTAARQLQRVRQERTSLRAQVGLQGVLKALLITPVLCDRPSYWVGWHVGGQQTRCHM